MQAYILQLLIICLLVLPFYLLARFLWRRRKSNTINWRHEVLLAVFVVFLCGLLVLVFRPVGRFSFGTMFSSAANRIKTGREINLVPFNTIRRYFNLRGATAHNNAWGATLFNVNILGNILMFVPVGLFPPLLWKRWRRFWKMLLVAFGFPVCIESVQLFIGRSVDVDDVLLNALGVLLGFGIARLGLFIAAKVRAGNKNRAQGTTPPA